MSLNYPCIIVSQEYLPSGFTRVALWWDDKESIQLNLFADFDHSLQKARYIAECLGIRIFQRVEVTQFLPINTRKNKKKKIKGQKRKENNFGGCKYGV
ncbi:hypothetical protein [Neisseria weaveri]|uniref:hypothetical protein n=1 Tax=Neisseria weaveri TaxID=28091 RepID=UPI0007C9D63A|nr:hypothetical protein [Neisseria weaveri]SAY50683.1 Uncharacterised protein [Neisseria weaveri]